MRNRSRDFLKRIGEWPFWTSKLAVPVALVLGVSLALAIGLPGTRVDRSEQPVAADGRNGTTVQRIVVKVPGKFAHPQAPSNAAADAPPPTHHPPGAFDGGQIVYPSDPNSAPVFVPGPDSPFGDLNPPAGFVANSQAVVAPGRAPGRPAEVADPNDNTPPPPTPVPFPEYGPVYDGDAYLFLGEWALAGESKPGGPSTSICFLPQGKLVVGQLKSTRDNRNVVVATEAVPVMGTYALRDDRTIELNAPVFPGGTWLARYDFSDRYLVLEGATNRQTSFRCERQSGTHLRFASRHPDIGPREHPPNVNGRITLFDGLRTGVLTIGGGGQAEGGAPQPVPVFVSRTDKGFAGQLQVIVEPGTPLPGSPIILVISLRQTDRQGNGQALNRLIVWEDPARVEMTWCPFHSTQGPPFGGIAAEFDGTVHSELDTPLRLPGMAEALDDGLIEGAGASLMAAGRALAAVWNDDNLRQLRLNFTSLPASKPGWPRAAAIVERALQIVPQADDDPSLVGLWIPTGDDAPASVPRRKPVADSEAVPGIPNRWLTDARLVLQTGHRFSFLFIDPETTQQDHDVGRSLVRMQGTWEDEVGGIHCKPTTIWTATDFTPTKRPVRDTRVVRFRRDGDQLELLSQSGAAAGLRFARHRWVTGEPPSQDQPPPDSGGPPGFDLIAMTGQPAPDAPRNARYVELRSPLINAGGKIAFLARTGEEVGRPDGDGLWIHDRSRLRSLATSGQSVPEIGPQATYLNLAPSDSADRARDWMHLSDSGQIAFRCTLNRALENGRSASEALVLHDGTQARLLCYDGGAAPGVAGGTFVSHVPGVATFGVGPTGQLWLYGKVDALGGGQLGLWQSEVDHLALVGVSHAPASGPSGAHFSTTSFKTVLPYAAGRAAVHGAYTDGPDGRTDHSAIWAGPSDALSLLVSQGQPTPAVNKPGSVVQFTRLCGANAQGHVLARLEISGYDSGRRSGLFLHTAGGWRVVMAPSQAAPRIAANATFRGLGEAVVNAAGDVFFFADVVVPAGRQESTVPTFWRWSDGTLKLLLRADRIADVPDRPKVSGFGSSLEVNALGDALIAPSGYSNFVWLVSSEGRIKPIVAQNEVFDFGPGDRRTVKEISQPMVSGGQDGRRRTLSDAGEAAFHVEFDNGAHAIYRVRTDAL